MYDTRAPHTDFIRCTKSVSRKALKIMSCQLSYFTAYKRYMKPCLFSHKTLFYHSPDWKPHRQNCVFLKDKSMFGKRSDFERTIKLTSKEKLFHLFVWRILTQLKPQVMIAKETLKCGLLKNQNSS